MEESALDPAANGARAEFDRWQAGKPAALAQAAA
jgi:hypothetical protein